MLYWAAVFLIIAIVVGVLGFGGIAGAATGVARVPIFCLLGFAAVQRDSG